MAQTLSLLAWFKKFAADPKVVTGSIDCPVLLWEAGVLSADPVADLSVTASGAHNFNPTPLNPLVLLVKTQATQSKVPAISIGRSETSDIVVPNPSVSRLHAVIYSETRANRWLISDAQSHNGTLVDGAVVKGDDPIVLRDGARIQVGDVQLRFLLPPAFVALLEKR